MRKVYCVRNIKFILRGNDKLRFVLLTVHRDKPYVKSIMSTMGLNFAMDEIEQKGMGKIAKMLEEELK